MIDSWKTEEIYCVASRKDEENLGSLAFFTWNKITKVNMRSKLDPFYLNTH